MKLAALFSGGKDSTMAVYDSIQHGHQVKCLITMAPRNPESYMFHYPNIRFTGYQARSMAIPHIVQATGGEKEKELLDLENAIKSIVPGIDGLVAGGLASNYQRNRIKAIARRLGLKFLAPYWHTDAEKYWKTLLDLGFQVMIVGVACEGLGKEWLGRIVDRASFQQLKKLAERHGFSLAGEGGEYESFVLDAPLFKKSIKVLAADVIWDKNSGYLKFKKIKLLIKNQHY